MANDQRFQRTVLAVAEAVQTFAAGTFDFAESIKQIWGPQTEPDVVETSNPRPVEGMQEVQVDQLRERTPVSQDGDQLVIHSHSQSPSVTSEDAFLEALQSAIGPPETANLQLSNEMDAISQQSVKCCYECFARWIDESPNPPCQSIPGQEACEYCTRMKIGCEMIPADEMVKILERKRDADDWLAACDDRRERRRFMDSWYGEFERVKMAISSPIADVPQQQAGSKRVYWDDEQQPVSKRQRTHEVREEPMPDRNGQLKRTMQREEDDHGAVEDRESSPLSGSFSSSVSSSEDEEEEEVQLQLNRQESSPIKVSYQVHKTTHREVINLEEENERSSTLTQEQSSEITSSEEDNDGYSSSSERETMQISGKEVHQERRNMYANAAIQPQESSEASSPSSGGESSEEETEDEPEAQLENRLAPNAVSQYERKETTKVANHILLEEESDESESSSASSASEASPSEEESGDEAEAPKRQRARREESPKEQKVYSKEPIQVSDDESSNSSLDEFSEEESESEPELLREQPATVMEPQKRREDMPEESIEITSDEFNSGSSDDEFSEEESEMET
ncbi:hypothetical protein N7517_001119 [Penicillium concentricum]|uniref:Uncharacterized protein n=1 Tax=Penicillium concentricum TaxID=293559 RepID=A0A9W9SR98_9EURO|nr:uncharacterized protein N7517_001119 [Penicillium concentricum]KAJ5383208.1 hypothetical protein N7517_001119 [Penicillium concentricum]